MKGEDFILKIDDMGNEYLTFPEGITKTRQSGPHEKHRLVQPKMFATKNSPRCPVNFFKTYLSKRPNYLRITAPLYLGVTQNQFVQNFSYGLKHYQQLDETHGRKLISASNQCKEITMYQNLK